MRSQIFAKSLPLAITEGALYKLNVLKASDERQVKLWNIVNTLQSGLQKLGYDIGITNSAVTPVYLKCSIKMARIIVEKMREDYGIFTSMVVYPVIPKGMILLRLIPTAAHSLADVDETLQVFAAMKPFIADLVMEEQAELAPTIYASGSQLMKLFGD